MALPTHNQGSSHPSGITPPVPSSRDGASLPPPPVAPIAPATPAPAPQITRPAMSTPTGGHVSIRPLRTYKDDLAEAIKKGGYSTASIQEAERKKKELSQSTAHLQERRSAPIQNPFARSVPKKVEPVAPRVTPPQKPLPPQPTPPTPAPIQIPSVSQKSGEERKTFFSQLLGHKKWVAEKKPEEKPVAPLPVHKELPVEKPQEKPAVFIPPPAPLVKTPTPLPQTPKPPIIPPPAKAPTPPEKKPEVAPLDTVRFIEEHVPEKKRSLPPSNLPAWAIPGETQAERKAEEKARQERAKPVAPPVFKPRLPLITREAPTRGSAVSDDTAHPLVGRSAIIAIVSILLIVGAGFGGYIFYKHPFVLTGTQTPFVTSQFISTTDTVTIDVTGLSGVAFTDTYRAKEQEIISAQSTRSIVPTVQEVGVSSKPTVRALTTSEFFENALPSAPGILVRALGDTFTSGVHASISGNGGFIVTSTENYDRALSGLLEWEPNMGTTIAPLLLSKASTGIHFTDKTISGVPVRVLGSGKEALVYGFIDKKILLIGRGEDAFGVLVGVIRAQK